MVLVLLSLSDNVSSARPPLRFCLGVGGDKDFREGGGRWCQLHAREMEKGVSEQTET